MSAKPEAVLTKRILKALRGKGGFWTKIHGGAYQATGLPDIIGVYEGCFYGLEVKTPKGGQPTARQALVLRLIKSAGGVSGVVRDPQDALKLLSKHRNRSVRLFSPKKWLTASQTCAKIGLGLGDRPISRWKLNRLLEEGMITMRSYGKRRYYSDKSINIFLKGKA